MDRKGFLKGLGVAAAALLSGSAARAAGGSAAAGDASPAADLPVKVRPQPRTVARPDEGSLTR